RYHATYPEVWPMMFCGPTTTMVDEIARGDTELGLFFHLPRKREEISDMIFAKVPFKLVIKADRARDRQVRASFIGSREVDDAGRKKHTSGGAEKTGTAEGAS